MLARNYFNKLIRSSFNVIKHLQNARNCSSRVTNTGSGQNIKESNLNQTLNKISAKYKIFKDSESSEIPDVYEKKLRYPEMLEEEPEVVDPFEGLNLERGENGVYELEDLMEVLEKENAEDVFVAQLPEDLQYVDYMILVSGKSYRHMQAIAEFVRKVYKQKSHADDIIPRLEGKDSKEWMALDLGNIALHIFSKEARLKYDLDTLWAVGPRYDKNPNAEDPVVEMLERHSIYLKDLKPAR